MVKHRATVIAVLILLFLFVFSGTICYQTSSGQPQNMAAAESRSVNLLMAGDLMCQHKQQSSAYNGTAYDFNYEFDYIRNILQSADLTIGNLETNISSSEPLGIKRKMKYEQPYLNAPESFLEALKNAGFDLLVNANNHNADTGVRGLNETIINQRKNGFDHTGIFTGKMDRRFLLKEINGVRIGFASYATYYNQSITDFTTEEQNRCLNRYSEEKVKKEIQAMRDEGADYIIIYFHCGTESAMEPNERQLKYSREIAEAGADYIVCSHSHTIQPYTRIKTEDGRNVPVAYALGNFVSSMRKPENKYGMLISLRLEKRKGTVELTKEGYYPSLQLEDNPDTGKMYQVLFCTRLGINQIKDLKLKREMEKSREDIIRIVGNEITPIE